MIQNYMAFGCSVVKLRTYDNQMVLCIVGMRKPIAKESGIIK